MAKRGIVNFRQGQALLEGNAIGIALAPGKLRLTNKPVSNDDEMKSWRQMHALGAHNFRAAFRQVADTAVEDARAGAGYDDASQQHPTALMGPAFMPGRRIAHLD